MSGDPLFRCAIAGGYWCYGLGLYCGIPCDGYPRAGGEPQERPGGAAGDRVIWYCPRCAQEAAAHYLWDSRVHRACPACRSTLRLLEVDVGGTPLRSRLER